MGFPDKEPFKKIVAPREDPLRTPAPKPDREKVVPLPKREPSPKPEKVPA